MQPAAASSDGEELGAVRKYGVDVTAVQGAKFSHWQHRFGFLLSLGGAGGDDY